METWAAVEGVQGGADAVVQATCEVQLARDFKAKDSGEADVVAFAMTLGRRITASAGELFTDDAHRDRLEVHWHRRVRAELVLPDGTAVRAADRYGFGYPDCPDLAPQREVVRLVDPEQSTSALVNPPSGSDLSQRLIIVAAARPRRAPLGHAGRRSAEREQRRPGGRGPRRDHRPRRVDRPG